MTTRESTTPPAVPTVTVATHDVDGSTFHAVIVHRTDERPEPLPLYGVRDDAVRIAAYLRGALADAYSAGRADGRALPNLEAHEITPNYADDAPPADDGRDYWTHPDAPAPAEWNGNAYRVEVVAMVEASTPAEAQAVTGCLLSGRGGYGHAPHALTGPGSWAPNVKRVERYEIEGDEVTLVGDPTDITG